MRFYIKTIAKFIYKNVWKYPTFLYPNVDSNIFPKKSIPLLNILARLHATKSDLNTINYQHNLGALIPPANKLATRVYSEFAKYNPNHLGNWSIEEPKFGTHQLEYEVVHKMIDLYKADQKKLAGHLVSGGSEGNLYSIWITREFLRSKVDIEKIVVMSTPLTHYSIKKDANICNLKHVVVPLSSLSWTIDTSLLQASIEKEVIQGKKAFIISLTHGYTETGSNDNIYAVSKVLNKLKTKNKGLHFVICVDASLNGLVLPFVSKHYKPFQSKYVMTYITDFHKFFAVPYSTGLALYKKSLLKYIEKPVRYVNKNDTTLAGSRPGNSAAAIWGLIHRNGVARYKKIITKQIGLKNYFIKQMTLLNQDIKIITEQDTISCGVIFKNLNKNKLPPAIEDKYWMYAAKSQEILFSKTPRTNTVLYKFYFLPHVNQKTIDGFIKDISLIFSEKN